MLLTPNLDLGVGALSWRVTAEDKRWLENSSYNRQYSHECSGMLFCFAILFPHLYYPYLKKQTNNQTKMLISICSVFILGSAIASSFIQPWLIFLLQFLFIFLYFFFFFFLSLIFGLFKPMSLFPFVGLWFQNSTIPTGISRTRVKKGYQIAEVGDSWKQSSIKGQRV